MHQTLAYFRIILRTSVSSFLETMIWLLLKVIIFCFFFFQSHSACVHFTNAVSLTIWFIDYSLCCWCNPVAQKQTRIKCIVTVSANNRWNMLPSQEFEFEGQYIFFKSIIQLRNIFAFRRVGQLDFVMISWWVLYFWRKKETLKRTKWNVTMCNKIRKLQMNVNFIQYKMTWFFCNWKISQLLILLNQFYINKIMTVFFLKKNIDSFQQPISMLLYMCLSSHQVHSDVTIIYNN